MINFDTFEEDDVKYLKLDQENIILNEHFKMYITSSISNPNFEPDISNKVGRLMCNITIFCYCLKVYDSFYYYLSLIRFISHLR